MFLAWNEIKYHKTRYILIVGIVTLVSYLVYFLTGLAYGLAMENRVAIDQWEADGIALTDESNTNIAMSMMSEEETELVDAEEKANLGVTQNVIRKEGETGEESKVNVAFFGIDPDSFLMPEVVDGEKFRDLFEVVGDISLQEEEGIELGDTLKLAGTDKEVVVTGFIENAKYSVSPVLYTDFDTYMELRYAQTDVPPEPILSGVVYRDENPLANEEELLEEDLVPYEIEDYIWNLPGYSAQILTFGIMILFLIVIAAVIIGIFIYVLTLQKLNLFGIMKAQGISTGYISKSVVTQTFLLSAVGVGVGLLLTVLSSLVLPPAVPYATNYLFIGIITLLLIVVAVLGGLFSVRTVVSVDPLEAIG